MHVLKLGTPQLEDATVSRINAPFVSPAPTQANPGFTGASPDVKPAPDKPRELGKVVVWIVLLVGLLVVADLLVARVGPIWTAIIVGLLVCVYLAFLINTRRSSKVPANDSASEKPVRP
jgi:hypothetical protein